MGEDRPLVPKPANEADRLRTLERCGLRVTGTEPEFDRITQHAARLFHAPIALVTIVGRDEQNFIGACGLGGGTTREDAFCSYTIVQNEPLVVPDTLLDRRFVRNPLVTGSSAIRFYAGTPLKLDGDQAVGSLCVLDTKPRTFDDDQQSLLRELASIAVDLLRLRWGHLTSVMLQRQVERRNGHLSRAYDRTRRAYRSLSNDLKAAARLQRSLLPVPAPLGPIRFGWMFQPSQMIGGDLFNVVELPSGNVAFFAVDVSGHGVPAALLSFRIHDRISRMLAAATDSSGEDSPWIEPNAMVTKLNKDFQDQEEHAYFTLVFGIANTTTGQVTLVRAGHPEPLLVTDGGERIEFLGEGGPPVGLFPNVDFPVSTIRMQPGDRLFLYSDGLTDCVLPSGQLLHLDELAADLRSAHMLPVAATLDRIQDRLGLSNRRRVPDDDVSLLVLEWRGRSRG